MDPSSTDQLSLPLEQEGMLSYFLWFKDPNNNLSEPLQLDTLFDPAPPAIADFQINAGDNFTNSIELQLSWQASDNGSGIKDFFLSETNTEPTSEEEWIAYQNTSETYPYTLSDSSDGDKTLTLYLRDFAGNITQQQQSIQLDQTRPNIALEQIPLFHQL